MSHHTSCSPHPYLCDSAPLLCLHVPFFPSWNAYSIHLPSAPSFSSAWWMPLTPATPVPRYNKLSLFEVKTGVFHLSRQPLQSLFIHKAIWGREQVFLRIHKHLTILTHQWDSQGFNTDGSSLNVVQFYLRIRHKVTLTNLQRRIVRMRPRSVCGLKADKMDKVSTKNLRTIFSNQKNQDQVSPIPKM